MLDSVDNHIVMVASVGVTCLSPYVFGWWSKKTHPYILLRIR